jgi:hypothetical protein
MEIIIATERSFAVQVLQVTTSPTIQDDSQAHSARQDDHLVADPGYWLQELHGLLWRFSGLGIGGDIYAMTEDELRGLYLFLLHLSRPE